MRKVFIAALFISAGSLIVPAHADMYRKNHGDEGGNANANAGAISGSLSNAENNNHNIAKGGNANAGAVSGSLSNAENHNFNISKGGDANAYSGSISGAKVDNDVRNTNKQGQHQGQGQHQSSESSSSSSSTSSSDNANNASQSVNFEAQERNPVNTAYAPPLAVGEDTCMGSSSIGGQGVGFGISIGTTWTDENCQRLKNSRQLAALGLRRASVALLCVNDDVARAMAAAGVPCRIANGNEWELSTVALPPDQPVYAPAPRERVIYSRVVEDRVYTPKKKVRAKKVRCRLVRQCH